MYETGRFYKSCDYYKEAYVKIKSEGSKAYIAKKVGNAYEKINKLRDASLWYKKSLRYDENNPEIIYKIIEIGHKRGDVKLIEKYLSDYEALVGDNPKILKDYMDNFSNSNSRYKIEIFKKLSGVGNDFSPVYEVGDTNVIYLTSTRKKALKNSFWSKLFNSKGKKDVVTGTPYSNIYKVEYTDEIEYKDKKGKEKIRKLKKPRWIKAKMLCDTSINSKFNEGAVCFSPKGEKMYFTSSRKIGDNDTGTKIYTANLNNEDWSNVELLNIVPDSISVGHPAISPGGTRLYFVSDMDKGYGGKDIWYCEKVGDKWGEPVNAGKKINTSGDEMYPYFRDNGQFYFASNGHSGLGGLDIYKVIEKDDQDYVENMGFPFNSEADDFGIVYKKGFDEGLFSSSRGKRGVDNIYKFKYTSFAYRLVVKTKNELTGVAVSEANVKLVSEKNDDETYVTDKNGKRSITLDENEEYLIVVYKKGYLKEKVVINTKGLDSSKNFEMVIDLKPIEKPIQLPNIFYDFGKWELKKESKKALNDLVKVLNINPNITIELSAHTDLIGTESDNIVLSQKRAQAVVDYLIEKGVYWDRLVAKGYGESKPKEVSFSDIKKYAFLEQGKILTKKYIGSLDKEKREYANQLNRRTEFKVLRTDYRPGPESKKPKVKNIFKESGVNSSSSLKRKSDFNNKDLLVKDLKKIKGLFFTLQVGVFNKNKIPDKYTKLKVVFFYPVKGKTSSRITHGILDSYSHAKEYQKKVKSMGIDCFITAYKEGKRIELKEAIKLAEKSN
jgi:peptidoglycan-associated lipoprotein